MIAAEVLKDSVAPGGQRLTTFKLLYPKMVHGEFMTHRRASRNAQSSRAVPVQRLLKESMDNMYVPRFVRNRPGMQGGEPFGPEEQARAEEVWRRTARAVAIGVAELNNLGVHKQHANRPLEWFGWIKVVASGTEWMNFFGLRLDAAAQPEIRLLAEAMWAAYGESAPKKMEHAHNWHLPLFEPQDWDAMTDEVGIEEMHRDGRIRFSGSRAKELAIKVSAARCARVSYESFDTERRSTVAEDLRLCEEKLLRGRHMSPFEHQATPDVLERRFDPANLAGRTEWRHPELHGNFEGWIQHRKLHAGEAVAPLPGGYK